VLSESRVELFGALRRAPGETPPVESRGGPKGAKAPRGSPTLNAAGYFRKTFSVRNAGSRTYRVTIDGRSRAKSASG